MEVKAAQTPRKEAMEWRRLESRGTSMGTWIFQTPRNPSRMQKAKENVGHTAVGPSIKKWLTPQRQLCPGASGHGLQACVQPHFGRLGIHLVHQLLVVSVWALSSLSPSCLSSLIHSQKTSSHLPSTQECRCYCSRSRFLCRQIDALSDLKDTSHELLQSDLFIFFSVPA